MLKGVTKWLMVVALVMVSLSAMAQQVTTYQADSLVRIGVVKFGKGISSPDDEQYQKMKDLFYWISTNPKNPIEIWGWADSAADTSDGAVRLAQRRAQGVGESSAFYGIPKSRVSVKIGTAESGAGLVAEYGSAVLYEVQRVERRVPPRSVEVARDVTQSDEVAISTAESMSESKAKEAERVRAMSAADSVKNHVYKRRIALRTNMLHWIAATPNVGVEFQPFPFLGVVLDLDYAPWSWGNGCYKLLNFQPQLRYYFGGGRRLYTGVEYHMGSFNMKFDDTGRQGTHSGAGVVFGYKLRIGERMNLDFNIGGGFSDFEYDKYQYSSGYIVKVSQAKCTDRYFGVTSAGVSLDWAIFRR